METKLIMKVVGNYRIPQVVNEECSACGGAAYGTALIKIVDSDNKWICIECLISRKLCACGRILHNKYINGEKIGLTHTPDDDEYHLIYFKNFRVDFKQKEGCGKAVENETTKDKTIGKRSKKSR